MRCLPTVRRHPALCSPACRRSCLQPVDEALLYITVLRCHCIHGLLSSLDELAAQAAASVSACAQRAAQHTNRRQAATC